MEEDFLANGILERFDSIVAMRGEEIAVMTATAQPLGSVALASAESDADSDSSECEGEDGESSSGKDSDSISSDGVTYMELQFAYQSVASQLTYRYGVRKSDIVLVCCKGNAIAEIVAMLACMKTNATFVPIDESWVRSGTKRLQDIVEDAQPVAAIVVAENDTDEAVIALAEAGLYRCIYVNATGDVVEAFNTLKDDNGYAIETYAYGNGEESAADTSALDSCDPLYILYTSGSTGRPKGVRGTESGLINRISWQMRKFAFSPGEVVCRRTPLVFVDAMAEIFSALVSMTPLWCPSRERMTAEGIGGIAAAANEAGVSRVTLLPSQLYQALTIYADLAAVWPSLATVFVSGEECTPGLVRLVAERMPSVTLVNLYGSTEVAGDVSYAVLHAGDDTASDAAAVVQIDAAAKTVPIGEPIDGNYLFVVGHSDAGESDSADPPGTLRLLGTGEVGELMVVGKHLALGYHNNAVSQSARFLPNPLRSMDAPAGDAAAFRAACAFSEAFLTGDLAYRSIADNLFYLCGRRDRQVKIRGVRLELEDVERQACAALGVDEGAIALAVESGRKDENVLVLVIEEGVLLAAGLQTTAAAKTLLQDTLLPAMVPAIVLQVPVFPRNTSGKLDRKELQRMVEATFLAEQAAAEPQLLRGPPALAMGDLKELSESEEVSARILDVYTIVLNCNVPQDADVESLNFFALGGDSVTLIEVLWSLRQWTGLPVKPADIHQSIPDLARHLQSSLAKTAGSGRGQDESPAGSPLKKRKKMDHNPDREDSAPGASDQYPVPAAGSALVIPADWVATSTSRGQGSSACTPGASQDSLPTPVVKWTTKLVKCVDASPLLIQWASPAGTASAGGASSVDIVVVGSHGGDVVAVHAGSGELCWTLQLGEHIEASAAFDPRTGLLFVVSFHGHDVDGFQSKRPALITQASDTPSLGCLWAIDAVTGQVRWHFCVEGETKSSPLVVRDHVLVGAYDGHLYQICCADGALVEKHACGGSVYAAPVLSADNTLLTVVSTSGRASVFSLGDPDSPPALTLRSVTQAAAMFSTPLSCTIDGKQCAMLAGTDGTLRCVVVEDADAHEIWCESVSGTAFFSSACTADSSSAVIGCHDGKMRKISLLDGSVLWECSVGVALFASPFLVRGGAACIAATVAGDVLVVDVVSGDVKGRLRLPAEIFSSPVCRDGRLFIGCRDDRLYCIEF